MNKDRYQLLMTNTDEKLTPEEISQGYHFCCEWDGLLINNDDAEAYFCDCVPKTKEQQEKLQKLHDSHWDLPITDEEKAVIKQDFNNSL